MDVPDIILKYWYLVFIVGGLIASAFLSYIIAHTAISKRLEVLKTQTIDVLTAQNKALIDDLASAKEKIQSHQDMIDQLHTRIQEINDRHAREQKELADHIREFIAEWATLVERLVTAETRLAIIGKDNSEVDSLAVEIKAVRAGFESLISKIHTWKWADLQAINDTTESAS